ncbi:MAG: hypothetical protein K2Q10_06665, partial [Rhodospirillales bacterium]|nr:hypothetical protein [Rhodospirillales bacterium]
LARRVLDLARNNGLDPAGTAVLVIGHGSKRPGASETTAAVATHLAATTPFAEVVPCYIEQAPFVRDWPALTGRHMVIAAPFLVAEGMHASEDLPPLFNLTKGETGPAEVFGRRVWLGKGIGSDPEIVDIILDRVTACDSW